MLATVNKHKRKRASTSTTEKSKKRCIQPFEWLPAEMVSEILSHLPRPLDPVLRQVCQGWNQILSKQKASPRDLVKWVIENECWPLYKWMLCRKEHSSWTCKHCIEGIAHCAVANGKKEMLEWLLNSEEAEQHWQAHAKEQYWQAHAKNVREIRAVVQRLSHAGIGIALKAGNLDMAKFIDSRHRGDKHYGQFVYNAYEGGSDDCIKWVQSQPSAAHFILHPVPAMLAATKGQQFRLLKELCETHQQRPTTDMVLEAMRHGRLDMLKWILLKSLAIDITRIFASSTFQQAGVKIMRFLLLKYRKRWASARDFENATANCVKAIVSRRYAALALFKECDLLYVNEAMLKTTIKSDGQSADMLRFLTNHAPYLVNGPDILKTLLHRSVSEGSVDALHWCIQHLHFRIVDLKQVIGDVEIGQLSPPILDFLQELGVVKK